MENLNTTGLPGKDKVAIVTGANSGMGMATAAALADLGYEVIMLCRNLERAEAALKQLLEEKPSRLLTLMFCNLGDLKDIRRFTDEWKQYGKTIDVLINNAGVISLDRRETVDGLEEQFGVNHIGHFLLTIRLLDYMKKGSRIVIVASGAHKVGKIHFSNYNLLKGFNVVKAYSQSKLANILFTRELACRLKNTGITVNCCHPGAVATSIGIDRGTGFGKTFTGLLKPFFITKEEGAQTTIYLATSKDVRKVTGKYFYKSKAAKTSVNAKSKAAAVHLFMLSENITDEKLEDHIDKILMK
ncbi:MAG: SDR family oxidoreductase [Anaerocolumna sp.]